MQTVRPGRVNRVSALSLLLLALLSAGPARSMEWLKETGSLLQRVQSGELPPVEPELVRLDGQRQPGAQGGELRLLMGKQKDIRQLVIYGYARLVGYTPEL